MKNKLRDYLFLTVTLIGLMSLSPGLDFFFSVSPAAKVNRSPADSDEELPSRCARFLAKFPFLKEGKYQGFLPRLVINDRGVLPELKGN